MQSRNLLLFLVKFVLPQTSSLFRQNPPGREPNAFHTIAESPVSSFRTIVRPRTLVGELPERDRPGHRDVEGGGLAAHRDPDQAMTRPLDERPDPGALGAQDQGDR